MRVNWIAPTLDSAPAPILKLADIREAVVKASAQGANFSFMGRILQFATAAGGEDGLNQLWSVLKNETSISRARIGKTALSQMQKGRPNGRPLKRDRKS